MKYKYTRIFIASLCSSLNTLWGRLRRKIVLMEMKTSSEQNGKTSLFMIYLIFHPSYQSTLTSFSRRNTTETNKPSFSLSVSFLFLYKFDMINFFFFSFHLLTHSLTRFLLCMQSRSVQWIQRENTDNIFPH